MKKEYLEIAKIINTHGIKGEVKLEPWCDSPEILKNIKQLYIDGAVYDISGVRIINGGYVLCFLSGITNVEEAAKLKNKVLSAKREDIPLPDGSYFIQDIIGLDVIDAVSGRIYGKLSDVMQRPSQDILVITTPDMREVLLPKVPEFVKKTDPDKGIFITPIEGFFS